MPGRRRVLSFLALLPGLLLGLLSGGSAKSGALPRLFLIGDSTVADYPPAQAPLRGWGQSLREILRGRAQVLNFAVPGRSSRLFAEQHWPDVRAHLGPGDGLLIQFGHVDALPDPVRHTEAWGDYRDHLRRFVDEARARGARPVLVTPVARYAFSEAGAAIDTHGPYAEAMRALAAEAAVPLIDLARSSAQALESLGPERARAWFMLAHDGVDRVHLSQTGADAVARQVAAALPAAGFPWANP